MTDLLESRVLARRLSSGHRIVAAVTRNMFRDQLVLEYELPK
jgi:hypothetical protein